MSEYPVLNDIIAAKERISPYIHRTPILRCEKMESKFGCEIYFKPETLQITGAFKIRGALNKALSIPPEVRKNGLIATSSGNHAQGLAYAAKMLGVKAIIVLPADAPKIKIENTRALGAEAILYDGNTAARWKYVYELAEKTGYIPVHAFEDPTVMAGQGTIGLEILEDLKDVDTVIVPMGGGGLISGISTAIKEMRPSVRVIGAEPEMTQKYYVSRQKGEYTVLPDAYTVADGLRLSVPGRNPYPIIERYVDEIITVSDDNIKEAMRMIARDAKLIVEPASAICIGTLLEGKLKVKEGEKVCSVLSGGNWDLDMLAEIYRE